MVLIVFSLSAFWYFAKRAYQGLGLNPNELRETADHVWGKIPEERKEKYRREAAQLTALNRRTGLFHPPETFVFNPDQSDY